MPRRLTAALLALLTLASCGPRAGGEPEDLTAQVLFTGNGTHDRFADRRGVKIAGGLRETTWETDPPLPARRVTVREDTDLTARLPGLRPARVRLTLADGRSVEVDMIAPGAQVRYALPDGAVIPASVSFTWLDDYGTPRDAEARVER